MKKQSHQQFSLDVAGPGSGKTTSLIGSVKSYERTDDLRDVVVITYTNFARDRIEDGLFNLGVSSDEVFIGTIHSFLIRYVISPFAHKYEEEYPPDLKYAEVETSKIKDHVAKAIYLSKLMKKGVVPYGKVESFAKKLLMNKEVAKAVAGKLQAVFVDEYQDSTTTHHAIFEILMKAGIDRFYCVGDSEQYIYGFTYQGRSRPVFKKIPMNVLINEGAFDKNYLKINWRSGAKIVTFLNNFVEKERRQTPDPERKDEGSVTFLQSGDLGLGLKLATESKGDSEAMMILSYASSTLELDDFAAIPMGLKDSTTKHRTITGIITEYICNFLRRSKQSILDAEGIDEMGFRSKVVEFADTIENEDEFDLRSAIALLKKLFPVASASNDATAFISLDEYLYVVHAVKSRGTDDQQIVKMTIHKAKGLEADVVLVIASSNTELSKWIATDLSTRAGDVNDTCRVGFVAFSRARRSLFIVCKEGMNETNKSALIKLGAVEYRNA